MNGMIRIGITGCDGRMGDAVVQELRAGGWPGFVLAGGSVRAGGALPEKNYPVFTDAERLFTSSDIIIDFTAPEATVRHALLAAKHKKPCVIGTTGLSDAQEKKIREAAKGAPIVYAANMSVGINILLSLTEQVAARLGPEWDIEIAETHHRHKADAPSGTALALGHVASSSRGGGDFAVDREGARVRGSIGFAVRRGGDVAGEHSVCFFGEGERIELSHKAGSRAIFARGALNAARWLSSKISAPGLYSMRDVLGL